MAERGEGASFPRHSKMTRGDSAVGVYIYKIKDRQTGKELFAGREREAAAHLGCAPKYLYQLAVGEVKSSKKSAYCHVEVSREWTEEPVYCVDCGVLIPGAGPTRKLCDDCKKVRNKRATREWQRRESLQKGVERVSYAVSQYELQKDCFGCVYYGGENYINSTCNYIFKEGHSRGDRYGEKCTKRKPKKRKN